MSELRRFCRSQDITKESEGLVSEGISFFERKPCWLYLDGLVCVTYVVEKWESVTVRTYCLKYKVVIFMGICAFLLTVMGCGKDVESESSSSLTEPMAAFSQYSQEGRKEYVHNYLMETYGVDCDISDVNKKGIDAAGIHLEEDYSAIATIDDENYFNVWISEKGEIVDSYFLMELKSTINNYFYSTFDGILDNYQVSSWISFKSKPNKQWFSSEPIENFLQSEPICAHVNIFVDEGESLAEETFGLLCERIKGMDVDIRLYTHGSCVFAKYTEKGE